MWNFTAKPACSVAWLIHSPQCNSENKTVPFWNGDMEISFPIYFYLCTLPSAQFVLVQVYHVYFSYMFRPDGAIFRCVSVLVQSPSLCYFPPTLASVHTMGVRGICSFYLPFFSKYIVFGKYISLHH
jgi:hypothetical protein